MSLAPPAPAAYDSGAYPILNVGGFVARFIRTSNVALSGRMVPMATAFRRRYRVSHRAPAGRLASARKPRPIGQSGYTNGYRPAEKPGNTRHLSSPGWKNKPRPSGQSERLSPAHQPVSSPQESGRSGHLIGRCIHCLDTNRCRRSGNATPAQSGEVDAEMDARGGGR